MERRELLHWLVATGGLAALHHFDERDLAALGDAAHRALRDQASVGWRALSASEARTVAIVAEHIIPRTDTPGATDANVTAFIDTMLADWYAPAEAQAFRTGLGELDARARALHNQAFMSCTGPQQIALVEAFDTAVTTMRTQRGTDANAHWFAVLKYLTVWGYCTSEPGMRRHLRSHPLPMRYDGNVPVRS